MDKLSSPSFLPRIEPIIRKSGEWSQAVADQERGTEEKECPKMYISLRVGLQRKLSAEELMLMNCGVG